MENSSPKVGSEKQGHDIIVIGGSSGSIEALRSLLPKIPANIPAALLVVIHTSQTGPYLLPKLLRRDTALQFATVEDKQPISYGKIYLARPNLHLLLEDHQMRVVFGPKENRLRPAIDPLFRSAAWTHQSRVVGVLLSGALDDGVAGLWDIRCCGGVTIVQDPDSALFPGLIQNALNVMPVDYVAPPEKIAQILRDLAGTPAPKPESQPEEQDRVRLENEIETDHFNHATKLDRMGKPSGYTCPSCGGPLWKLRTQTMDRYRCRVGHVYSSASLFQACWETSERQLYSALQLLEENAQLGNQMITKAEADGHLASAELIEQVRNLEREADILRDLLYARTQGWNPPDAPSERA
ncbi:MAG: chemotaxis protein CheB [Verrucomicrobia bacterium]|nr:chemotaxis protein CheB [Verrucomicrobiota bacterium]MBV8485798.1 chemotaxis protein CheB [Verrucomicrobiota bacterium]